MIKTFIIELLKFTRLAFSENGQPSSKRVLGGLIILIVLFCTVWSVVKSGMTENNKNIIEFEIISASALLGVSNITAIWKGNKNTPYHNEQNIGYQNYNIDNPDIDNPDIDEFEHNSQRVRKKH